MFLGEYEHSVDHKGRVSVPKKFRQKLGSSVLTRGLDKCLFLYPEKAWQTLTEKLASLPLTQSEARSFSRYLLAGAVEVDFDSLGRVMLPMFLRQYASITFEAVFVGVGERVEIWEKKRWQEYRLKSETDSEAIAEKLTGSGI